MYTCSLDYRCCRAGTVFALLALLSCARAAHAEESEALWNQLKNGGHILLLRHAQTEAGSGDPPNLQLGDCTTQRNLSEAGRVQAERIGAALRARGVAVGRVRSSEYCRCLDTARLAFTTVEPWPVLNSIFETATGNDARVAALQRRLGEAVGAAANEVLVTHNVNINAATGIAPAMGEMVVVAPDGKGGFSVLGRLLPAGQ